MLRSIIYVLSTGTYFIDTYRSYFLAERKRVLFVFFSRLFSLLEETGTVPYRTVLPFYFNCQTIFLSYRKYIFFSEISKIKSRFYVKKTENNSLVNLLVKWNMKTFKI